MSDKQTNQDESHATLSEMDKQNAEQPGDTPSDVEAPSAPETAGRTEDAPRTSD